MFGSLGGREISEDEQIARIIARETSGDGRDANWERYLPAARKLLSQFDMRPARRQGGSLFGG